MALLGLAVAGVVAAFTWLCGCWDESLPDELDRAAGDGPRGFGGPANDAELQTALDQERRRKLRESPPPAYWGDKYRTTLRGAERSKPCPTMFSTPRPVRRPGSPAAWTIAKHSLGAAVMDLYTWLPAMFFLGLATLGLLTAFVLACDKI